MKAASRRAELSVPLLASRPRYLGAGAGPVLVGSALGYSVSGGFDVVLSVLEVVTCVLAALMLARRVMFFASLSYLPALSLAVFALRSADEKDVVTPGLYRANQLTVPPRNVGSVAPAAGLIGPALLA